MNSRHSNSLAASRRSQSTICRCTSGSDTRRRSGRGGKSPPWATRAGSFRPALPFAPDQKAVRQHHTDGMPVEPLPPPTLILVPAQQPLGLLMKPLHPVPPVRVFHQASQGRIRPQVTPVILPLPFRRLLTDQPAQAAVARGPDPPGAHRDEPAAQPAVTPVTPRDGAPRPRRKGPDPIISPLDRPAVAAPAHGEIAAHGGHVALPPLLQAVQEVGVVAVIGVGDRPKS
jgi:hypothetical protein